MLCGAEVRVVVFLNIFRAAAWICWFMGWMQPPSVAEGWGKLCASFGSFEIFGARLFSGAVETKNAHRAYAQRCWPRSLARSHFHDRMRRPSGTSCSPWRRLWSLRHGVALVFLIFCSTAVCLARERPLRFEVCSVP